MKPHASHLAPICLLLGFFTVLHGQVIVANRNLKANEITKSEVRMIFTGESTLLKDGSRAVPVVLKAGQAHEEFLKTYIGKSAPAFLAGWRNLMFSGRAAMPKTFDTESALLDYVAANPSAIGYVGNRPKTQEVKALQIN